jgi:hypothetical protein
MVSILSELLLCPAGSILPDSWVFTTHYVASSRNDNFDHDVENNNSFCPDLWYCKVCGPIRNGLPGFIL